MLNRWEDKRQRKHEEIERKCCFEIPTIFGKPLLMKLVPHVRVWLRKLDHRQEPTKQCCQLKCCGGCEKYVMQIFRAECTQST